MVSGYRRQLALAMACQTMFVMANTLMTHYNRWIEHLGGDLSLAGWIMGAGPVVGLLLRPWVGQWINRWGAARIWGLGYLIFAAGLVGNLSWPTLYALFLWRASLAVGSALVFTSSLTYITLAAPLDRRTEAIGLLGAGGFVGMLFGPTLGDYILGAPPRDQSDFQRLFWAGAALIVLPWLGLNGLAQPRHETRHPERPRLSDFWGIVRTNWPGTVLITNLVFGLCMAVPFVFLASYVDALDLQVGPFPAVSVFFWAYAGWGLFVRLTSSRWSDQLCRRRVLIWGLVLMGVGMLTFLLVPPGSSSWLLLPALLCGTAHAIVFPTMVSLTLDPFPSPVRGTGSALSLMAQDLGMIAGAPILGQLIKAFGFDTMFVLVATSCLIAAAVYGAAMIRLERQEAQTCPPASPPRLPGEGFVPADELTSSPATPAAISPIPASAIADGTQESESAATDPNN